MMPGKQGRRQNQHRHQVVNITLIKPQYPQVRADQG